jgi:hypothetical protein
MKHSQSPLEYKVMLRPNAFAGGNQQLREALAAHEFKQAMGKTVGRKDQSGEW